MKPVYRTLRSHVEAYFDGHAVQVKSTRAGGDSDTVYLPLAQFDALVAFVAEHRRVHLGDGVLRTPEQAKAREEADTRIGAAYRRTDSTKEKA